MNELICMGKYPEHMPVCDVITNRWFSGGELYEESIEYWYCERCKDMLESPDPVQEDNGIPF